VGERERERVKDFIGYLGNCRYRSKAEKGSLIPSVNEKILEFRGGKKKKKSCGIRGIEDYLVHHKAANVGGQDLPLSLSLTLFPSSRRRRRDRMNKNK
jgi:hypothetical protein